MRKKMLFDMLVWSIATGVLFYFIFMIFNIWFHGEFTIYEPNQFILAVETILLCGAFVVWVKRGADQFHPVKARAVST
jgi:NADH:ubiquinone oxidoreductase subunit 6 (subunit J)